LASHSVETMSDSLTLTVWACRLAAARTVSNEIKRMRYMIVSSGWEMIGKA
jgi:hypothetical protein